MGSTGDIISRLGSDASIVGDSVTRELGEGLRALLTATIGLGLMCYISLRLTAVMCLIVPPSAVAAVLYGRYIRKLSKRTQKVRSRATPSLTSQAVGELTHVAEERISAVRTVHAFNAIETQETKRFQTQVDKIVRAAITRRTLIGSALAGQDRGVRVWPLLRARCGTRSSLTETAVLVCRCVSHIAALRAPARAGLAAWVRADSRVRATSPCSRF